jgi:cytochrome P450 monooxygenase
LIALSPAYLARSDKGIERPNEFDLSRWLDRGETQLSAYETSPFGGGPHFCIGYHLAWQESLQFLIGLALHLGRAGLRPRLAPGSPSSPRYVPFGHPHPKTTIAFL